MLPTGSAVAQGTDASPTKHNPMGIRMALGLHLLFPSISRLGWYTTTVANPREEHARGTAFLFRGQGAVFSRSFGLLCDRLRMNGIWAEDCRCTGDRWACRCLESRQSAGAASTPVVFIGHSRGGRRAIAAAAALEKNAIAVDLLIGIDVAFARPVPANVRQAVHLFRSAYRLYPARPWVATTAQTVVENVDLDVAGAPFPGRGLYHLNITRSEAVRNWIINRVVREAVQSPPTPALARP